MPTYSYRCTQCDNAFDIQQAFTEDTLTECPSCGGKLRKLFNTVGVTFNGSGFYRTDSRAATGGSSSAGSNTPTSGSGGGSGTGSSTGSGSSNTGSNSGSSSGSQSSSSSAGSSSGSGAGSKSS